MLNRLKSLFGALLVSAWAFDAAALAPDPTGMWMDPAESGWGMSVAQQGETTFVVLFVYDDSHRPTWYFASDVRFQPPIGFNVVFSGTLYRTTGPSFAGPFDPHAVGITPVGTIELVSVTDGLDRALDVSYTVDGVHVAKRVRPQTWGDNLAVLTSGGPFPDVGRYAGGPVIVSKSDTGCADFDFPPPPQQSFPFTFSVSTAGASPGRVYVEWGTGIDTVCQIQGTYSQHGQLGAISGPFACGVVGAGPGPSAPTIDITNIVASPDGFSGSLTVHSGTCTYGGHIGGVRVP
ncbi:MAG TPA: hypothetical protein VLS49_07970 [Usitatibacter sp.]|nr:hypothetical protein [Usitatibacter sp.]